MRPINQPRNPCSASDSICGPQSSCLKSRASNRLLPGVLRAFSGPCRNASPEGLTRLFTPFYFQVQDPCKEAVPWGEAWGAKRSKRKKTTKQVESLTVTATISLREKYVCPAPRDEQLISVSPTPEAERAPAPVKRTDPNCCAPKFQGNHNSVDRCSKMEKTPGQCLQTRGPLAY